MIWIIFLPSYSHGKRDYLFVLLILVKLMTITVIIFCSYF